jgi:hypothetical protein
VQAQQQFSQIGESGPQHINCAYNCYVVWDSCVQYLDTIILSL